MSSDLASSQAKNKRSQNIPVSETQSQVLREIGRLEFDKVNVPTFEEFLGAGEVHTYRVHLDVDQYVLFRAEFVGFNGVISLYSPSGTKLEEVLPPDSTETRKELWWITKEAGVYQVRIKARAVDASGKYLIKIHELLTNDEQNAKRITASRSHAEGWRLHEIGTQEALLEAIPKLQTAISLWNHFGENWNYQEATMFLGEVYHYLSEYRKAIQVYETILPFLESDDLTQGDRTWTYNNLAKSYNALGETEKAREYCQRSLDATERVDRFLRETRGHPIVPGAFAIALNCLGDFSFKLGEKQQALDYFYKAVSDINSAPVVETFRLARSYRGLSQVYASLGDHERALKYADEAFKYSRDTADFIGQVDALNIMAAIYSADGNYVAAIASLNEALKLAPHGGDRIGHAKTLANLGYLHLNAASLKEAEKSFNNALVIFRAIENPVGEARALTGLGMVANARGDAKQAIELYIKALPLREFTIDREGEAETRFEMARAYLDVNELDAARKEIETALERIEFVRRGFSSPSMRASYRSTVQRYRELYIRILMLLHERNPNAHFEDLAFEKSELFRARSLLESLQEAGLNIREGIDSRLLQRERKLRQLLSDKGNPAETLNRQLTTEQKAVVERDIDALVEELRQLEAEIYTSSPHYAALTQPDALTLKELQEKILDADTVLLEYEIGEESSFLWVVTRSSIASFQLPNRSEIETVARRFYTSLSSPSGAKFKRDAKKLSEMLLGSVANLIKGKRLLIVADGMLQYTSFSALPDPISPKSQPLSVNHEIVMLPSASTLVLLRSKSRPRQLPSKTLAVLADPVFSAADSRVRRKQRISVNRMQPEGNRSLSEIQFDLSRREIAADADGAIPRLPSTRREALTISRSVPSQMRLVALDFDASRATALTSELGQYRIVHFATHGLLNSKRPELSGLMLSMVDENGLPSNGFLQAHEIYNLKLPVDLVVLSACRTALGKNVKGEGLLGITRGFMYAGAPRIVSSLWEVDSQATAELMSRFYHEMLVKKLSPAAALRAAQISMWRDPVWSSPNYWAGFVIQGEYQ